MICIEQQITRILFSRNFNNRTIFLRSPINDLNNSMVSQLYLMYKDTCHTTTCRHTHDNSSTISTVNTCMNFVYVQIIGVLAPIFGIRNKNFHFTIIRTNLDITCRWGFRPIKTRNANRGICRRLIRTVTNWLSLKSSRSTTSNRCIVQAYRSSIITVITVLTRLERTSTNRSRSELIPISGSYLPRNDNGTT